MKKVIILGATGSIGSTCLKAIKEQNLPLSVVGLVAYSSKEKLDALSKEFNSTAFLMEGKTDEELFEYIKSTKADIALNGIAGAFGLRATILCLASNLDVALANKESIVMGGAFILEYAKAKGRRLIPVDSEHSAIYHLINDYSKLDKVIITASGGPFLHRKNLENVTIEEAANHPTWKMGVKISIDSATLLNKGLEVIEAGFLFNLTPEQIEVSIHRQSIVHSMIRRKDGSVYAQLSPPDMTLPIISALLEGQELNKVVRPLDFTSLSLTFEQWDRNEFPLLALAFEVLNKKQGYPIAFNAADEIAVEEFRKGKLRFTDIATVVLKTLDADFSKTAKSYEEILAIDHKAREIAKGISEQCFQN